MNEILFLNTPTIHIRFASNFAFEKISELLEAKGLSPEVAIIRVQKVFGAQSEKASLYLHNLQSAFDAQVIQKVYMYIAHKALLQEPVLFTSYDQLLRMLQQVYSTSLSKGQLQQLKHISQANQYSITLRHH